MPQAVGAAPRAAPRKAAAGEAEGQQYVLKFVLVGDTNVGKSQLVLRFAQDQFSPEATKTVGMEFATRELAYYGGARLKAQIWDTAGQDRYSTLTQAYYRGAVGAMLVYDVTDRASFDAIKRWLKQVRDNAHRNIALSLIANKSDLAEEGRCVPTAEGLALAEAHGMDFVETSAATGENVETAFRRLIMAVARLLPEGKRRYSDGSSSSAAGILLRRMDSGGGGGGADAGAGDSDPPPEGWVRVESTLRAGGWSYENIWTGERVADAPRAPAVEYNTLHARALTRSFDLAGVGLPDDDARARARALATCASTSLARRASCRDGAGAGAAPGGALEGGRELQWRRQGGGGGGGAATRRRRGWRWRGPLGAAVGQ
ncbi:ras family-domain-containing protein [Tribonema minus]|uniref:Ras family-domain-containing protein n=1 Tax=Tribonema minus TaxID=303371 RepID=A0A836CHB2_9STRA|nr:ras family-domain-containing protein [Tribonema minus]